MNPRPGEARPTRRRRRHLGLDDDDSWESHSVGTRGLCIAAVVLMLGSIGVAVVDMPLELMYFRVLNRLGQIVPHPAAPEDLQNADSLQAIIELLGLGQLAFYLGFVVVFLIWLYRSYANLSKMGATGLSYSPGWAVGCYFVPFLNLVRPYQVMQQIWKASDPGYASDDSRAWRNAPGTVFVGFWWCFWLTASLAGQITFRIQMSPTPGIDSLKTAAVIDVIGDIFTVAAGTCLLFLIYGITGRQEEKQTRWREYQEQVSEDLESRTD